MNKETVMIPGSTVRVDVHSEIGCAIYVAELEDVPLSAVHHEMASPNMTGDYDVEIVDAYTAVSA